MEIAKVLLAAILVHVPRHRIDAGRRSSLQCEEGGAKDINCDVMQERCQFLLVVPGDGFSYAGLRLGHGNPALRPDRALQPRIPNGPAPSLYRLRRGSSRLVRRLHRYYGRV